VPTDIVSKTNPGRSRIGLPAAKAMPRHGMPYAGPCAMPNLTPAVEYALHQLEPLLHAYREREVDLTDVTQWFVELRGPARRPPR
jgi:hypothetical protein